MTPQEIARSPKKLSRAQLRTVRAHLLEVCAQTGSPHAYLLARDGDGRLVELRVEGGEFSRTPVDPAGRPTGQRQHLRLRPLAPAWALAALPVLGLIAERVF